ncbi:MAG: GWxTD domain-containing protein [Bacteroidales bacterium]|nr:GWxTD domain-containing protein [Bacteroidales bacterium]
MIKNTFFTLLLIIIGFSAKSSVEAYFSYTTFNSPEGSYVETSITAVGKTLNFAQIENGNYQASLEVTILFKKNDEIVKFSKYNILSPEITEKDTIFPNFTDLQRIPIENGIYNLEIIVKDNVSKESKTSHHDVIVVSFEEKIQFSGIRYLEKFFPTVEENAFSKNGFDLMPYNIDFFPLNMNKFSFYCELYNTDKHFEAEEVFVVKYFIEGFQTELPLHDYNKFIKKKPAAFDAILGEFSIEKLPSGNYNFVVEVRDKENKLVAINKKFFFRSNPVAELKLTDIQTVDIENTFVTSMDNIEVMREYIKYLWPISNQNERLFADNQLKSNDLEFMQKYFYNFWYKRNSADPEQEWNKYHEEVKKVNKAYGDQLTKGYASDQGRVYLQYGPPNQIIEEKRDLGAIPFEIWHYYKIPGQSNVRFVFYDHMKTGFNYRLLHSEALGEMQNYNWANVIYQGTFENDPTNPYTKDKLMNYPGKAGELYNQ